MGKKEKKVSTIPKGFTLKWSTQLISYSVSLVVLGYITYYCTDSLGLNAGLVGMILLIAKLFDGLTDLIAAVVIERTRTRWGKARPYVLMMAVAWIFTILMFSTPSMPAAAQAAYIFVCYFIVNSVCITLANGADTVYLARALPNAADSSTVLSYGGMITAVFSMIVAIVLPLMIDSLGTASHGWTIISMMFGIPCAFLSILRFFLVKERSDLGDTVGTQKSSFGFRDMIRVLIGNPHVFVLVLIQLVVNIFTGLTTVATYYFQYIMGDIKLQSVISITSLIGMVVIVIVPTLLKKMYPIKVIALAIGAGFIGCMLRMIPSMPVLIAGNTLTGVATIPIGVLLPALFIDCMDYNEWKTGVRIEAVFGTINAFSTKLGNGLASVLTGAIMALTGYNGLASVQSASAQQGIIALYSWIPGIMFVIMLIITRFYKIDPQMKQARAELEERRKKNAERD